MKVAVDATPLMRKPDGVGRYSSSLVSELVRQDSDNTYRAIGFLNDRTKHHAIPKNELKYEYIPLPRQVYSQWFKRVGPVSVNRWLSSRPDVVLYPNFVAFPKVKGAKSILIIHDLAFIDMPETIAQRGRTMEKVLPGNLSYLQKFVPRSIEQADAIVAVSEETQAAIAKRYGINASDITVVPNAVDNRFFAKYTKDELQVVQKHYGLPEDFILFLGTIEPRKNVMRLLEAYEKLPAKLRETYPLVLAGKKGWKSDDIYAKIKSMLEQGHTILTTGFIEDEHLPGLLQSANALVFPSIHEGFGLPILEGFASGVPVICSDIAPMNRLAENAAAFIDPESPTTITNALKSVLGSKQKRQDLRAKGKTVAKKHTWHASAQIMKQLINHLANHK